MTYKKYKTISGDEAFYCVSSDGRMISFIADPANTDYQAYLKWLEEGNEPIPADAPIEG